VRDHATYDYAVIRVVPRVEREEFLNVGVILACQDESFLEARVEIDEPRLLALHPGLDLAAVRRFRRSAPAGRLRARSESSRVASASTGSPRRAARSSRPRPCTLAGAPTRARHSSI
jgi:hypothetical protein